ncbi:MULTISPECIES: hypothetical protein [unclassified Microbacterium]|uniref:hypothetical protein n=1 Tax=unclassified Microbacterium TaxID=2609290 RepID=UPI002883203A|nr:MULTISPECIES: hypothetical protein [unclassified Microbacterium]
MSASSADAAADIAHLCDLFLFEDLDAQGWAFLYPDESEWESPDCDIMSRRFLELARREGLDGELVHVTSVDEGPHWFAVLADSRGVSIAVDWTARQFYNAGYPASPTDPELIPCPLIFAWPGAYPLAVVEFEVA